MKMQDNQVANLSKANLASPARTFHLAPLALDTVQRAQRIYKVKPVNRTPIRVDSRYNGVRINVV